MGSGENGGDDLAALIKVLAQGINAHQESRVRSERARAVHAHRRAKKS